MNNESIDPRNTFVPRGWLYNYQAVRSMKGEGINRFKNGYNMDQQIIWRLRVTLPDQECAIVIHR